MVDLREVMTDNYIESMCRVKIFCVKRLFGLQKSTEMSNLIKIKALLPYYSADNIDYHLFHIGMVWYTIETIETFDFFVLGDFHTSVGE